jgi:hypothetical protein
MAEPQMTRQELLAARERLIKQLQVLRSPTGKPSGYFSSEPVISELEKVLAEIDAELAETESKNT